MFDSLFIGGLVLVTIVVVSAGNLVDCLGEARHDTTNDSKQVAPCKDLACDLERKQAKHIAWARSSFFQLFRLGGKFISRPRKK